jgi:hypothetical protein
LVIFNLISRAVRSVWYSGFEVMAEGSCFFEDIIEAEQRLKGAVFLKKFRGRVKAVGSYFFEEISRPSKG